MSTNGSNGSHDPHPRPPDTRVYGLPQGLASIPRWVNWKPVWVATEGRWTKPPVDAKTGKPVDITNSKHLKSFDDVWEGRNEGTYGIGFALAKDIPGLEDLKAIDLDHCVNPETHEIDQWARDIVTALRSYTEASPSGDGLHCLVRGTLPDGYKHKVNGLGPRKAGVLEVYEEGRYLTITGNQVLVPELPATIERRDLYPIARYVGGGHGGEERTEAPPLSPAEPITPDAKILAALAEAENAQKFQRLWAGDTSEYAGDDSAADLALCNLLAFYTSDADQIDRIFRQSGLMREKWARDDYRERTIATALEAHQAAGNGSEGAGLADPAPLDAPPAPSLHTSLSSGFKVERGVDLMTRTLPDPKWAIPGLLCEGVSILAGTKSVGKSWLALNLAVAVANGEPALGKIPVEPGPVLYLALEDGQRRMRDRLYLYLGGRELSPNLVFTFQSPPIGRALYDCLGRWVDDNPEARLMVLDLFANVYTPEPKKSAYFGFYEVLGTLRSHVEDLGVPLLLLHHTNTRTDEQLADPFDRILGGQGMKGPVAECLVLRRERQSATMSLEVTGKDIEEATFHLERDERWRIHLLDEAPKPLLSPERQAIMKAVKAGCSTPPTAAKSEFVRRSAEEVRPLMTKMVQDGQLIRDENGAYLPAPGW